MLATLCSVSISGAALKTIKRQQVKSHPFETKRVGMKIIKYPQIIVTIKSDCENFSGRYLVGFL